MAEEQRKMIILKSDQQAKALKSQWSGSKIEFLCGMQE